MMTIDAFGSTLDAFENRFPSEWLADRYSLEHIRQEPGALANNQTYSKVSIVVVHNCLLMIVASHEMYINHAHTTTQWSPRQLDLFLTAWSG